MKQISESKTQSLILILVLIPVIIWVIYRWFDIQITHDEAWSFHMAYKIKYRAWFGTANNHWLNSLCMVLETHLIGTKVWMIRIHIILGFFIFAYYFYHILMTMHNKWIAASTMVLVLYNTYLTDFFSIGRGYALGMAFNMMAIYYFLKLDMFNPKNRLIIYFILSIATFSVYTELYFLFAYLVFEFFFLFKVKIKNRQSLQNYLKPLWLPGLVIFLAYLNLNFIRKWGDLEEGATNGFFQDTLATFFIREFEPLISLSEGFIISILLYCILIYGTLLFFKNSITYRKGSLSLILIIASLIHYIFFHFFKIPIPYGRTSLYFISPLLLAIGFNLDFALGTKKQNSIFSFPLFIIIFCFHIYYAINFKNRHTTYEFWRGQGVKEAIEKIHTTENRPLDSLSILFYEGQNGNYYNYYLLTSKYKLITNTSVIHPMNKFKSFNKINRNPNTFDYIWLPDYDSIVRSAMNFNLYDSIDYYPDMQVVMYKKKIDK